MVDDLGAAVPKFEIRWIPVSPEWRISDQLQAWGGTAPAKRFESEDGSFVIDGLAKGEWILTATQRENVASSPVAASVPALDNALLLIVLPRPSTIDGRVLGSDDSPVSGASIHARVPGKQEPMLHMHGEEPEPLARSDAEGRFHLEDITPGDFELLASPPDGCDSAWTEVTASPGARTEVTLRLNAGGRIVGVVDPSCGITAGRGVALFSHSGTTGWRETTTDSTGRFVIDHVVPQEYVAELRSVYDPSGASGPPGQSIRRTIAVKPGETTDVSFKVGQESVHVRGIARRSGRAVQGMDVTAYSEPGTNRREQHTQTDTAGAFDLRLEELGEYTFGFSAGQGSHLQFRRKVAVPEGDPIEFDLPAGNLSGVVLSPTGAALYHVPVTLLRAPDDPAQPSNDFFERYRRTTTDEHGRFNFEILAPGNYSVRAPDGFRGDSPPPRTPYGGVVIGEVVVGNGAATPLEIRLLPEGKISGVVLDAHGVPVPKAGIQVFDSTDLKRCAYYELRTDVRGWFEIDSIAPGTYTVGAAKDERRGRSRPVEVLAGKTAEVKVELP